MHFAPANDGLIYITDFVCMFGCVCEVFVSDTEDIVILRFE